MTRGGCELRHWSGELTFVQRAHMGARAYTGDLTENGFKYVKLRSAEYVHTFYIGRISSLKAQTKAVKAVDVHVGDVCAKTVNVSKNQPKKSLQSQPGLFTVKEPG